MVGRSRDRDYSSILFARTLGGDVDAFESLRERFPNDLHETAAATLDRSVTKGSLLKVLNAMLMKQIRRDQAQEWASFIRRGYIAGLTTGLVLPIDIEYDSKYEHQIVEVIARLDEIGDAVDGGISDGQIAELIRDLRQRASG